MKKFINNDFLLRNEYSQALFHKYSSHLPLVDYHCHLDAKDIAQDATWENISQIWLSNDHYKWRAMRTNGVDEFYCTGNALDRDKFQKFAEAMPNMLRNPIYDWSHLELARYFGIDNLLLNGDTAQEVWDRTSEVLSGDFSAKKCMLDSNVEVVCTTDDPCSNLSYHKEIAESGFKVKVLPTFRPDKAMMIDSTTYKSYIKDLEGVSNIEIKSYDTLLEAIEQRHNFFATMGCKLSDYGLESVYYLNSTKSELDSIFKKAIKGQELNSFEVEAFKANVFLECAKMDSAKNWVRQIHIGPMRNNNSRNFAALGADTGFDSIGQSHYAKNLSLHLDSLASSNDLGKTILYNIDPKDNEMLATMIGNFQDGSCAGKLQLGSAWWFMDNITGMKAHLDCISRLSLLGCFVGMLTDSRSFLSYTRHEYFRRILCDLLGEDMLANRIPQDIELVGNLVKNISYKNAKNYFNF